MIMHYLVKAERVPVVAGTVVYRKGDVIYEGDMPRDALLPAIAKGDIIEVKDDVPSASVPTHVEQE